METQRYSRVIVLIYFFHTIQKFICFFIDVCFFYTYSVSYDKGLIHSNVLCSLIEAEQYRNLVDYDNHLDDITLDWQNCKLNKIIETAVEKSKLSPNSNQTLCD